MNEAQDYAPKPSPGEAWEVVIIGSGPASLTAAIYTTRGAASTLILGGETWGGQLMLTTVVDNYPALPQIQGPDLMAKMKEHATRFGAQFLEKTVTSVDFNALPFKVKTSEAEFLASAVIVATGAETKWLGVPGEEKLRGRGISSCAPCDAPFFKGRNVAVIGGGDSAMEEALVLTKYASSVTIIHRKNKFRASAAMQAQVLAKVKEGKIKIIWDTQILEFFGDQKLEKIKLKNTRTEEIAEPVFDGAFIAIGHIPATQIFKSSGLELDEKGYVVVHDHTKTNIPGIFVAGDVHDWHYRQAITAAGFGCMAAMDALKFLAELDKAQ